MRNPDRRLRHPARLRRPSTALPLLILCLLQGIPGPASTPSISGPGLHRLPPLVLSSVAAPISSQEAPLPRRASDFPRELVLGRKATVKFPDGSLEGELLSVSNDSLWVLEHNEIQTIPLHGIRTVDVKMHDFGVDRIAAWTIMGGLASAFGLTEACASVADDCWGVFAVTAGLWAIFGGYTGAAVAGSSHRTVEPSPERLRPYVRYPQGMPGGKDPGGR